MPTDKSKHKPTGNTVRSTKGEATENSGSHQTQIHQGNVPVLTVRLLDQINVNLNRIATALEEANG